MSHLVETRLTLRIPRDSGQRLYDEAVERVRRTPAVDAVETFDVTGVRPGLNDLRVRARATLACDDAVGPTGETAKALSEAVAIESVEIVDQGADS